MFPLSEEERRIDELHGIKRNPLLGFIVVTIGTVLFWSFVAFMMFGCEVEPYEPACVQGEYIHGHLCTEEYAPVCAPDGTTYANSCYAFKDGWEQRCVTEGECE